MNKIGWDQIGRRMLQVYICLNVAYCFPELWDPNSGRTTEKDYRSTVFYQKTLIQCANPRNFRDYSNVSKYPHSRFFGLNACRDDLETNTGQGEHWLLDEDCNRKQREKLTHSGRDVYNNPQYFSYRGEEHPGFYGRVSIGEFLSLWLPNYPSHEPIYSETIRVRMMLCSKGLPMELALDIMKLADYNHFDRQLDPPHDPLHPSNREELGKHLKYCWQTMVRCYMITKELGLDPINGGEYEPGMNWTGSVAECIVELFGHPKDEGHSKSKESDQRPDRIWYTTKTCDEEGFPGYVFL